MRKTLLISLMLSIVLVPIAFSARAAETHGQGLGIVTKIDDRTRTITVNNETYQIAPEIIINSDDGKRIDPVALSPGTTIDIRWRYRDGVKVIEQMHVYTQGKDFTPPQ
ncbi:MAG: hypothetical protein Kow0096_07490 [Thiohalomonadaceae bacterium]